MSGEPSTTRNVIASAWGDGPPTIFLYATANNTCYVGNAEGAVTTGLHCSDVFTFDKKAFEYLRTTPAPGAKNKLISAYPESAVNSPYNGYK